MTLERAERAKTCQRVPGSVRNLKLQRNKCVNESGTQIASFDFSKNPQGTSHQNADAANVEMETEYGP